LPAATSRLAAKPAFWNFSHTFTWSRITRCNQLDGHERCVKNASQSIGRSNDRSSGEYRANFKNPVSERRDFEEDKMVKNFDDMQKLGKENLDATVKSFGALSKSSQVIAAEMVDFQRRAIEDSSKAMDKLFGSNILEKAIEIQTEFAKSACEAFIAEATKIGGLYANLAKEAYKPYESYFNKAAPK